MNASSIIIDYTKSHLFEPKSNWLENYFAERSFSRWAAYEIQERITKQESLSPIEVILEFINEMEGYLCLSDNRSANLIFSTARDVANDILCLFL